ncbi:hypothetical protein [Microbulbifer aggregans]|uniref:hypothetical protein n=1 Tax=Microbulbifer aggregans TaxID=1769779 RepID=UPI001CFCE0A3|nr:hypothetical protein [Microbulbifer aggregans]
MGWIDPLGLKVKEEGCSVTSRPTHTASGERIVYFKKEDIKFKRMYGAEYQFYLDAEEDYLELAFTSVGVDLESLEFYINNRFNRGVLLKGDGFGLANEIISKSIDIYTKCHGYPPKFLDGAIIKKNLQNFQKEFSEIRASGSVAGGEANMHSEAIKRISFGRERVKLGYDDIEVTAWGNQNVEVDGEVLLDVPTKVKITANKRDVGNG